MSARGRLSAGPAWLRPGDPVWYRRRASPRYALHVDVPGLVVRCTATRVTLRTFPACLEAPSLVVVHVDNVRRRPPHDCGRPDCRECTTTRDAPAHRRAAP